MSELEPVDLKQCQCEIPNGEGAFSLGGKHKMVRCTRPAVFVMTEKTPGSDGQCGAMSVCKECRDVFLTQAGAAASNVEIKLIEREGRELRDRFNALPRYNFLLKPSGNGVQKWENESGDWIEHYATSVLIGDAQSLINEQNSTIEVWKKTCTQLQDKVDQLTIRLGDKDSEIVAMQEQREAVIALLDDVEDLDPTEWPDRCNAALKAIIDLYRKGGV